MSLEPAEFAENCRALFDTIATGMALYSSTDGRRFVVTALNGAGERMSSVAFQYVVGRDVCEVFPGIVVMGLYDVLQRVWTSGTAETLPVTRYDDQRISRYYENQVYKISPNVIAAVFTDVTEQKMALRESTQRAEQLRVVFETSQAGILMVDPTGAITLANNRMAQMLGYTMEALLTTHYADHLHPDQLNTGDEQMRKLIAGAIDHVATERRYVRKDGSDFWGFLSGRRHEDAEGKLISLVGHITNISALKHSEAVLRESEECFKALSEASFGGVIIHDKGRILECNQGLSEMTGFTREELIGMDGLTLIAPGSLDTVVKNIQNGYDRRYEVEGVRKDGSLYPLSIQGKNVTHKGRAARVIEFRDITERKRVEDERLNLEKQLLHAQKLESLGVLAGGIAHDFNNILLAIIGNADLALMRINKESPAVENLRRIEQAASRAADLAKQMLAYSGKGRFVVENMDLNLLLEEMLHMLEVSISKKAVLRLNLHKPLPSVEVDATQIRQIVMNLVINASEAIGDKSGVIAITTGCMDCDRSYLKDVWLDENITEGLYVYLEIADSGCGMDKETVTKLFDPFFTTKFTGRGLGMAAVLGIVRGHKGAIKVYSEEGRGTSFKVLLPASGKPAELFNGATHADDWRGSGTVLLVDDEETVRGIGAEMLKELGFMPITANDGREAVAIFRQNPEIAFVILDLTMPHMDGEQCFRELRQLSPDIKVIMSSGYNEQEVTQKFVGKGLAGFIQKPYKLSLLKDAIRKVL